jgi:high-affinity iron transporter
MDYSSTLPTFIITLREGVEAALVIGIVLAYLKKSRQSHLRHWVYSGIGFGLAISAMVGVLLSWFVQQLGNSGQYGPVFEPLLEGVFSTIAVVFLSWMLIWMTHNAKNLKSTVERSISSALDQTKAGWRIFALVFFAVLREGFETVLFIASKFQQGIFPAIGAFLGLMGAMVIGLMFFKLGIRLNLRKFFMVMGFFLLLIVSGLVITALDHFDTVIATLAGLDRKSADLCFFYERFAKPLNRSCILGPMVWNFSMVLPDDQFPGMIFNTLAGYKQRLFTVQAVAYVTFLGTIGTLYFKSFYPAKQTIHNQNCINISGSEIEHSES